MARPDRQMGIHRSRIPRPRKRLPHRADRIVKERRAIGDDYTVEGSQGQIVAHPLLAQLRADENHLSNLLNRLDMPEPEEQAAADTPGTRSARMRAVADSRWSKAFG